MKWKRCEEKMVSLILVMESKVCIGHTEGDAQYAIRNMNLELRKEK